MKNRAKKLTATLMALFLLLTMLPAAANAAGNIYVAGVSMADGTWLAEGASTASSSALSDNYAHYENGVLTLKNFRYSGKGAQRSSGAYVVYAADDLTLRLEGSSALEQTDSSVVSCGIYAGGDVTVNTADGGELSVSAAGGNGIEAHSLTVNSGKLTVLAPWALYLNGGLGKLTASAGMNIFALKKDSLDHRLVAYDADKTGSYNGIIVQPASAIYVGGVRLTNGMWLAEGSSAASTFPKSDNFAHYANGVLTLKNYDYSGAGYGYRNAFYGIYTDAPLLVRLEGENSIALTADGDISYGLRAEMLAIDATADATLSAGPAVIDGSFAQYGGAVDLGGYAVGLQANSVYLGGGRLRGHSQASFGIDAPFIHAHRGILVAQTTDSPSTAFSGSLETLRIDDPLQLYMGEPLTPVDTYDPTSPDASYVTIQQEASATRLAGRSRYDTAFLAADALKEQLGVSRFSNAIVTSGENFADALAGSYLAARKDAPILLTDNSNMSDVIAYIHANVGTDGKVYALGGAPVVSDGLFALEQYGYDVVRLSGNTRFDTNLAILEEAGIDSGMPVLVCTAYNFADSLSASAVGLPILLADDALTQQQLRFLRRNTDGSFLLVGGTGAVTSTVEDQLLNDGSWVYRLAGKTRFETSTMLAQFLYNDGSGMFNSPASVTLVYAYNFPDGLCAGPLAYAMNAPLILTANGDEAAAAHYASTLGIRQGVALGGESLISSSVMRSILSLQSTDNISGN